MLVWFRVGMLLVKYRVSGKRMLTTNDGSKKASFL
jgi:hypothetical protein